MTKYKCPYCGRDKYTKVNGYFSNWLTVRRHISNCNKSTGEYFTDANEGPIHYTEFTSLKYIKQRYPNLKSKLANIKQNFKQRGILINYKESNWSREDCIKAIQNFYKENGRIPYSREFDKTDANIPTRNTITKNLGSWNKAIEAAGFEPNDLSSFGNITRAKDGHKYRSGLEAQFVNKFLFKHYDYVIEPNYPKPYNRVYDWYVPKLNLYIELYGGIRPEVIQEKIKINTDLNRKLLVVKSSDINRYDNLISLTDGLGLQDG